MTEQFKPTLPVTPTAYPRFWRTPAWTWWRPIVAVIAILVAMFAFSAMLMGVAIAFETATGRIDPTAADFDASKMTAIRFIANNLGVATLIPSALLIGWLLFRQRPGWLAGVRGAMRWGWLGRCLVLITPLWLVTMGITLWLDSRAPGGLTLAVHPDTWVLLIGVLLTTPLQAAGEEFGFRGVVNRAGASYFRNPTVGLVVGTIVSTALFAGAHGAADPWLNTYYIWFGLAACLVVWRTGGLEGAIAMHAVNNVFTMALASFGDLDKVFQRDAGTSSATALISMAVVTLAAALIIWQHHRLGLDREAAPAASMAQDDPVQPTRADLS